MTSSLPRDSRKSTEWLDDYLTGLSDQKACRFFYDHMHADLDLDDVEYEVGIPAAIIEMVRTA